MHGPRPSAAVGAVCQTAPVSDNDAALLRVRDRREQGGDAEIIKRTANAKESIAATLAGMKATAESST